MKKHLLLFVIILCSACCFAQNSAFTFSFDHQAIMVSDLTKSADFYLNVLGLKEIDNKTGKKNIRWFSLGEDKSLHLITGDNSEVALNKTIHLAIKTPDFEAFVKHLEKMKIEYWDWVGAKKKVAIRNDGAKQVYIQDPDGYWIEINNDLP